MWTALTKDLMYCHYGHLEETHTHFQSLRNLSWLAEATKPFTVETAKEVMRPSWADRVIVLFSLMFHNSNDYTTLNLPSIRCQNYNRMYGLHVLLTIQLGQNTTRCIITQQGGAFLQLLASLVYNPKTQALAYICYWVLGGNFTTTRHRQQQKIYIHIQMNLL